MRLILAGDADAMVTGGTEASITGLTIAGFGNMRALSQSNEYPEKASKPFDKDRDGFVLGEGSGILVIESESHAKNRGANILAELAGFGSTDDAFHITQPSEGGTGALLAMERAIFDARLNLSDILYTYVLGKTSKFKELNIKSNDFRFCVEFPIKIEISKMNYVSIQSYEKKRIGGIKKSE